MTHPSGGGACGERRGIPVSGSAHTSINIGESRVITYRLSREYNNLKGEVDGYVIHKIKTKTEKMHFCNVKTGVCLSVYLFLCLYVCQHAVRFMNRDSFTVEMYNFTFNA